MAVVAHGRGPDAARLARRALWGMRPLLTSGRESAMLYLDVLAAYLDEGVLAALLEEEMQVGTYQPISDLFLRHRAEGRHEGRTEGLAAAVLTVLTTRGMKVPRSIRARVLACTDAARLDVWLRRATTAAKPSEIFDEDD